MIILQKNIKEHNPKQIPDNTIRMLKIRGSRSWKRNTLLNPINHKLHTDKICLYAKDMKQNTIC